MKIRMLLSTALLVAVAASSFALSSEYAEWGQGPAQFLMTKEETARWKSIKTDEEAKAFVDLFWARRDPTPSTPRNELREQFEARVEYADKNLASSNKRLRGAMTDRGKTLVLYGQPKRVERSGARSEGAGFNERETSQAEAPWIQWIYEGDALKDIFSTQRALIRFVDRIGNGDYRAERGSVDLHAAQERMIEKLITQPDLTAVPTYTTDAALVPVNAPTAEAAPAVQTELTTESLKAAVAAFKAAGKSEKQIFASWGEFITPSGTYFVPVMLYVPKAAGLDATKSLTFFGVVQDESGKNVSAFEQPATLVASKDDFFIDTTLMSLPAGKNRGFFGLAENGKAVAMASTEMTLAGSLDKDATAISSLILSNNVYPLSAAQQATDPFAFGGVKVIPKADKAFRSSDELWYFFELRHPGLSEDAQPMPKIQAKLDVEGTTKESKKVKMSAPPSEVAAIEMKGVPGHYGVGSSIPLTTFKPGDYTFTVKVIDTVKKTSYTLSEKFTVIE